VKGREVKGEGESGRGDRVGKGEGGGSTWLFVQGPPEFLVTPLTRCGRSA